MTLKKLLMAVSVTAMAASSANAISISNIQTGPVPVAPAAPVLTPSGGITPALELTLPTTTAPAASFAFDLDIDTVGGNFPVGNDILSTITLPAGVSFASAVNQSVTVGGSSAVNVQSGGAIGDTSVTLRVTALAVPTLTFGGLNLALTSCPAAGSMLTVTANTTDGQNTPVEGGTASTAGFVAPCASAINGVVASDEGVSDTQALLAGGFVNIGEIGSAPGASGDLGTINYFINPTVSTTLAGVTPLAPTDITSIAFDLVFGSGADISAITVTADDGTVLSPTVTGAGGTRRVTFTAPGDIALLTNGVPAVAANPAAMPPVVAVPESGQDTINVNVSGMNALPTQTVSIANAVVTFNDSSADLIASEPGANGALDAIQRQGQSFGTFDWNGDAPTGTLSVYRATGFTPGTPVAYTVTMSNSGANGSFSGMATPTATGEIVLNSRGFGGVVPTYGRGDAVINFETAAAIDVDRLLIRGGVVSDFGGGANRADSFNCLGSHPLNDADNAGSCGAPGSTENE